VRVVRKERDGTWTGTRKGEMITATGQVRHEKLLNQELTSIEYLGLNENLFGAENGRLESRRKSAWGGKRQGV